MNPFFGGGEGTPVADAIPERRSLADRINRLWFAEYRRVGWFKVAPIHEIRDALDDGEAEVIERYARDPADPSRDGDLIRLFLGEWLVCQHPESVGAFGLDPAGFRPVDRAAALSAVDGVVAASLEDPQARIKEGAASEPADVPYLQLRVWFAELFGGDSRSTSTTWPAGRPCDATGTTRGSSVWPPISSGCCGWSSKGRPNQARHLTAEAISISLSSTVPRGRAAEWCRSAAQTREDTQWRCSST